MNLSQTYVSHSVQVDWILLVELEAENRYTFNVELEEK